MAAIRQPARYHLILPLLLIICVGLAIGLTYAPCYSSLCVEEFFPYTARVHLALFYSLLASVGIALLARAHLRPVKNALSYHISDRPLPWTMIRVSVGALLLSTWIAGLVLGSTGYWISPQEAFWSAKGTASQWTDYTFRVTWTGITGHWCDLLFGLVIVPVGRNSVLARVFGLHSATLLRSHQLLAYALLTGGLIHGFLYYVSQIQPAKIQ